MIRLIQDKQNEIRALCRKHQVARLEVFGSAADGTFDPDRSDVDFLVAFEADANLGPWLSEYFDLKAGLERLLGYSVDLVMPTAMRNPYFIDEANRTRCVLYGG